MEFRKRAINLVVKLPDHGEGAYPASRDSVTQCGGARLLGWQVLGGDDRHPQRWQGH